jgi:tetratricopeptide (TPR) repeat protein
MRTSDPCGDAGTPRDVTEQNVERLLDAAYRPETPDPAFVRRLTATLCATARAAACARRPAATPDAIRRSRLYRRWALAAAAALAGLVFGLDALLHTTGTWTAPRPPDSAALKQIRRGLTPNGLSAMQLTPRPRLPVAPVQAAALGETLRTGPGERRRVGLPDGSVLYLNENTTVQLPAERKVTLTTGEVFAEVAPRNPDADGATFLVKTANREIAALGTRFDVQADDAGTGVVVTQGKVKVSGLDEPVAAGEQLPPGGAEPAAAPRASYVLDWARDLMIAADSPLVPESKYTGGALVAVDPSGQEAQLSLRKYAIDVHIEDGFARTTIDQTYFNEQPSRLEGTFYFPLPADASLSRLAMYVDGTLMEGGMAERDYARAVFESIVRRQRDPALLEWVDGTTFKMRVFPLEGRQEKRIILSYTQKLSALYGHSEYRFPAGHSLEQVRDWSFHTLVKGGAGLAWKCRLHELKAAKEGGDLLLDAEARNVKVDRDVVLELNDKGASTGESVRFSSADNEGTRYLMLRYRPSLPGKARRERRDWVFLFESGGDRDPLLARVQVEVARTLLANAEHDDTFAILTTGAHVHALVPTAQPATPENVKIALDFLDRTHLVGALDLGQALAAVEPFVKAVTNPYLVHLGSGIPALGERREDVLAGRVPEGAHYVGIGVGKRWSRSFMKAAAERTDGYFTQINPDEPVGWRAFELFATLSTPRLLNVKVVDNAEKVRFLTYAGSLAQGEELCAIACTGTHRDPLPESLTVSGTLDGKPYEHVIAVKDVTPNADYVPRTWAKLEIERLLAEDAVKNKDRIVALSKGMYVMTPYTSLLVLENEAMYAQYKVDRGRKDHWAMYACPPKISVVYEPLPGQPGDPRATPTPATPGARPPAEEVLKTIFVRVPPRVLYRPSLGNPAGGPRFLTALQLATGGYRLPGAGVPESNLGKDLADLSNPDIGIDLNVPLNLNVDRIEEVSVPGQVDPNQPVGIPVAMSDGSVRFVTPTITKPVTSGWGGWGFASNQGLGRGNFGGGFSGSFGGGFNGFGSGGFQGTPSFGFYIGLFPPGGTVSSGINTSSQPAYFFNGALPPVSGPVSTATYGTPSVALPGASGTGPTLGLIPDGVTASTTIHDRLPPPMPSLQTWGESSTYTRTRSPYRATNGSLQNFYPLAFSPDGLSLATGTEAGQQVRLWDVETGRTPLYFDRDLTVPGNAEGIEYPIARLLSGGRPGSLLYERPAYTGDDRLFTDLLAYAPGMNTSRADILAVLEAEAAALQAPLGRIDADARVLIDRARGSGWQSVAFLDKDGKPAFTLLCDGAGRHAYEHTLSAGLAERVVCDGKTLLHLYPDLGVGARRTVSRFHRADFAALVPWLLPPAEDLARGADLKSIGERIVALVPRGAADAGGRQVDNLPYDCVHLVFAADGRLAERRLVEMPAGKVLSRETYDADGVVKVLDGDGKELAVRRSTVAAASAPNLAPDTRDLVVVPLPVRRRDQIFTAHHIQWDGRADNLDAQAALELVASDIASGSDEAQQIIKQRFLDRGDRRPGFGVLWAAVGSALDAVPVSHKPEGQAKAAGKPSPALQASVYLEWLKHRNNSPAAVGPPTGDGLLPRLAAFHELAHVWQADQVHLVSGGESTRLLDFLHRGQSPAFAWALVDLMLRSPKWDTVLPGGRDALKRHLMDEAVAAVGDAPGLGYVARYEHARALFESGDRQRARELFRELYAGARKDGALPAIDAAFRQALQEDKGPDSWEQVIRQTADGALAQNRYLAIIALAWQCAELDDQHLADDLLASVLGRLTGDPQRLPVTVAAVEYLWSTHQFEQADRLVQPLLADATFAQRPSLWRLGARLAAQRKDTARQFACLEKALDLEYQHLPDVIDLQPVRQEYGALLGHYTELARAMALLHQAPPRDFLTRVVSAADRWRALDSDGSAACLAAGRVLETLGHDDLAWDYMTTPLAARTNDATAGLQLARALTQEGSLELADRAYRAAAEAEPSNADVLWERSQNLEQAGKPTEARRLLRQLADTTWADQYQPVQQQARRQLQGR